MKKLTKTLLTIGGLYVLTEAVDIFGEARSLAVAKNLEEECNMSASEVIDYFKEDDELDELPVSPYCKWKCKTVGKMAEGLHTIFFK